VIVFGQKLHIEGAVKLQAFSNQSPCLANSSDGFYTQILCGHNHGCVARVDAGIFDVFTHDSSQNLAIPRNAVELDFARAQKKLRDHDRMISRDINGCC
jgi:hypothetical protein